MNKLRVWLFLLSLLIIADGVISYLLVSLGIGREANPLLSPLVSSPSIILVKTAMAIVVVVLLNRAYAKRPRATTLTTIFCSVAYLAILAWNLSVFAQVS